MGKINRGESGVVSIVVAIFIIIIVGLITIGFTRVMQREQRQSLDRQLSSQALYAAESGINEVFRNIDSLPDEKLTCDPSPTVTDSILSAPDGVEYTCILYNKIPPTINSTSTNGNSKFHILQDSDGDPFENITISWGHSDSLNGLINCTDASNFPDSRPDNVPILKVDLTNMSSLSRTDLRDNTDYVYLSPCNDTTGVGVIEGDFSSNKGKVYYVKCTGSDPKPCSFTFNNLNSSKYFIRYKPIYAGATVSITGVADGSVANFVGEQVNIDVTARANDVVRRLNASVPFSSESSNALIPEGVIQSFSGVCKQLSITGTTVTDTCFTTP